MLSALASHRSHLAEETFLSIYIFLLVDGEDIGPEMMNKWEEVEGKKGYNEKGGADEAETILCRVLHRCNSRSAVGMNESRGDIERRGMMSLDCMRQKVCEVVQ